MTTPAASSVYPVSAELQAAFAEVQADLHARSDRLVRTLSRKVLGRPAAPGFELEFTLQLTKMAPFTLVLKSAVNRDGNAPTTVTPEEARQEHRNWAATLDTLRLRPSWTEDPAQALLNSDLPDLIMAEALVWFGQCWAQAGGLGYPMAAVVRGQISTSGGDLQHFLVLPQTFRRSPDPAGQDAGWEQATRRFFQLELQRRQAEVERALRTMRVPSGATALRLSLAVGAHFDPVTLAVHRADTPFTAAELEDTEGTDLTTLEFPEGSEAEQTLEELTRPFDSLWVSPYDALFALECVPFVLDRWRAVHGEQPEVLSVHLHEFLDEWPLDVWDTRGQRWQRGVQTINGGPDRPVIAYGRELQRRLRASPPPVVALGSGPVVAPGERALVPLLLAGLTLCMVLYLGLNFL